MNRKNTIVDGIHHIRILAHLRSKIRHSSERNTFFRESRRIQQYLWFLTWFSIKQFRWNGCWSSAKETKKNTHVPTLWAFRRYWADKKMQGNSWTIPFQSINIFNYIINHFKRVYHLMIIYVFKCKPCLSFKFSYYLENYIFIKSILFFLSKYLGLMQTRYARNRNRKLK